MKHIEQLDFYEKKFEEYGDSCKAVAQNDIITQHMRFDRVSQVFKGDGTKFTIHDLGCGLGHYHAYLMDKKTNCIYSGSDISNKFIQYCKEKFPDLNFYCRDILKENFDEKYDYVIQSGMFNTSLNTPKEEWRRLCEEWINMMFEKCNKGIAFNFLTSYSDFYDEELYYSNPCEIIRYAIEKLSRFVTIDHSYPLYEYTCFVYKEDYIKERYTDKAYRKYFK